MADNIIDIEGFEKYGPALNSSLATYNANTGNIMNVHNNVTNMRFQGWGEEWFSTGGSTGSSIGFITGRAGGSSKALAITDGSGNTTSATKILNGNYSRTIVGFAFVCNLGTRVGLQFNEIAGGGAQVSIWVDSSGRINFGRGNMGNNILFTSSALFVANVWHYIEVDFTISSSAGHYQIWFDGTSITNSNNSQNTLGSGSNAYWNAFIPVALSANGAWDDIYIRDNTNGTATPFGDCTVHGLSVSANSSVQFSPAASVLGTRYVQEASQTNATGAQLALVAVTPAVNMTVNSISTVPVVTSVSAKFKGVIYADSAGTPGSLLSSGTEVVSCQNQTILTLPLVTPQALTANTQYWIGYITDTSITLQESDDFTNVGRVKANTYASGAPASASGSTGGQKTWTFWGNCTLGANNDVVNKTPSPIVLATAVGYNSSSTAGQKDLFTVSQLPIVPNQIYSVKVSALAQRSDTGVRTMNIHLKSGATDSTGTNTGITPGTSMQWYSSRYDTDPATSGAWGPTAVNGMKIGYEVAT